MRTRICPKCMSDFEVLTDAEFVTAFRGGDRAAFAGIYDRYADRIYSYCLTMLRNPDDAADASQDVFVKAATHLDQLQDPEKLRPWLFAVARNEARSEGRYRSRVTPEEDRSGRFIEDPDLAHQPEVDELRMLVWEAVDGLGERDRELMALHLTEGLEGEDLAQAMGVEISHLDVLASRMKSRMEKAMGALLISRLGSDDCDELPGVLGEWDGRFDRDVRARVTRHVGSCETCQVRRAFLMAPANILPGIMVVAAPVSLRSKVLEEVAPEPIPVDTPTTVVPAAPAPHPRPSTPNAATTAAPRGHSERVMLVLFAAVTVILGLIGLAVSAQFERLDPPVVAAEEPDPVLVPSTTTTTLFGATSTTLAPGATTTAAPAGSPAAFAVSLAALDFGGDATTGQFDITNSGGETGTFTVAATSDALALSAGGEELAPGATVTYDVVLDREQLEEGDIAEVITVSWDGGSHEIAVTGSLVDNPILHNPQASPATVQVEGDPGCTATRTTISVRVRDTSPLASVVARWSPDGGRTLETAMSDVGGDIYEVEIGPFSASQTAAVRIVATDELGNAGGATAQVTVNACP